MIGSEISTEERYKGNVEAMTVTKAASGNPQIAIEFSVHTHLNPERRQWDAVTPFRRTVFLAYSGGAIEYTDKKLESLGFNGDPAAPQFEHGVDVELRHWEEEYNGEPKPRWDLANWGGVIEEADEDTIRNLRALMSGKFKQRQKKAAPQAPAAASPAPPAPQAAPATKPAPPPGTPNPDQADTREKAWACFCANCLPGEPDESAWRKAISKVASDNGLAGEQDFGPDQWKAVAKLDDIPF